MSTPYYLSIDNFPFIVGEPTGGTGTFTAAEIIAEGNLVTMDATGGIVLATAVYASGRYDVIGVAKNGALIGQQVTVYIGLVTVMQMRFAVAPAAASNSLDVFLSATSGLATLTAPTGAGNVVVKVGTLKGGNGVTLIPECWSLGSAIFSADGTLSLASANTAGTSTFTARADHRHAHGDRGPDGATSEHDADQVDVEGVYATIGAPASAEVVFGNINTILSTGGNHATLTNLVWTSSAHTGTASRIAAFDGGGAASYLAVGTDVQAFDADLSAIAALATTGLAVRTGVSTWSTRTLVAPAAGLTIANPAGIAGDPTFALADDLAALEGLAGTGFAVRTGASTWTNRTITAASASVVVTDGSGVAANPTIEVASATDTLQGKIELATQAEVDTGTDTTRAITPATLAGRSAMGAPVYWGQGSITATTTTRYLSPGFDPGTAPTARVPFVCNVPGTIDKLEVAHDTAGGSANTVVYTVRKGGVAQTLTVTVAANSTTPVLDGANSFTVVAGNIIDIEVTKAASITSSPGNPVATFRFKPS